MAKIGNITIVNKSESFDSGAAFLMQKLSPVSSIIPIDSKSVVEVEKDNLYVVARTNGLSNHQEALDYGHELVQKGLDILSITGQSDLGTRDAIDDNFVWWCSNDRITLRITDTGSVVWGINGESVTEEISPTHPSHSRAFRYFRLSQITNDLFDAYRNMYLAFELLASEAVPRNQSNARNGKTRWEPESKWLTRYLGTVPSEILTSTLGVDDPIQAFQDQIYKNARCPLFHAKNGESFFCPHGEIQDRQIVAEALSKLTRIFLLLAKAKEQNNLVRGLGASMSTGLEKSLLVTPRLNNAFFKLSDDDSPFDMDEKGFDNPRYKRCIKSEKVTENVSNTHKHSLIGYIRSIDSGDILQIRRIELVDDHNSLSTAILEAPLYINEIDVIEIQLNPQLIFANSANNNWGQ